MTIQEIQKLLTQLQIEVNNLKNNKKEPWESWYENEALPHFDWEKCLTAMKAINFGWVKPQSTTQDLQEIAKNLLESAYEAIKTSKPIYVESGGLVVSALSKDDTYYFTLSCVIESWDNY